jgi:predicted TIM-barrel fold metal-dependent hydrolase
MTTGRFRIDVHHHYHLAMNWSYNSSFLPTRAHLRPTGSWKPETHFEFMDKWGIDAAILSDPTVPRLEFDYEDGRALCRQLNDFNAELITKHGDRFGTFAAVPMPDIEGSIVEARRALTELGLDGIFLGTHYFGRHLGDSSFDEFHAELDRLKAVVYVHPTWSFCAPEVAYRPALHFAHPPMEFVFETTRTIASIVYSGVAKRYPNIRWIFSHGGGTVPFLSFRFAGFHTHESRFNEVLPEGPATYFKQLYYETAQAFSKVQLEALKALTPLEHILFGTDYPPMGSLYADNNKELAPDVADELPANGDPAPAFDIVFGEDRAKVERMNALELFPKLAARVAKK